MRRLPIRLRLTLAFGAAMAVLFAVLAMLLYTSMNRSLLIEVDRGLRSLAQTISSDLQGLDLTPTRPLIESDETFAQILAPDGRIVTASPGFVTPALDPPALARATRTTFAVKEVDGIDGDARILAVPVTRGAARVFIVVGSSLQDRADAMHAMAAYLAAGGPVALLLASYAGWLVAGFALRPVEQMRREASAISVSELDRRVGVPGANDELRRLATTLNAMLERLEESITTERRFLDDASHELRTPLTVLRSELDVALSRPRGADELTAALRSASEETDRLARMAEDLLVLSRLNHGRLPVLRKDVALRGLLEASSGMFAARAEAGGVRIEVDAPDATVHVDDARVRQAVDNLLDNALRVSARGDVVGVRGAIDDGQVVITVDDKGPGFAAGLLTDAFEPFRHGDGNGSGLGLAIVKAVAESHGGTARAENLPDRGARIWISLAIL